MLISSISDFPCGSAGKKSTHNAGDMDSIPGLGRSLKKGKATHSSILTWRIPRTSPWGLTTHCCQIYMRVPNEQLASIHYTLPSESETHHRRH